MPDDPQDGSGAILDEYAARDARFRVVHQANVGVSAARNAGLDLAKGEWLGFVDPDDVYGPALLDSVLRCVGCCPDVDACRFAFTDQKSQLVLDSSTSSVLVEDISLSIGRDNLKCTSMMSWQYFFRSNACRDVRFRNYVCGEDRFYTFECLERCRKVAKIPENFYYHRVRPGAYGTSMMHTCRGWEGEILCRVDFLRHLQDAKKRIEFDGFDWIVGFFSCDCLREMGKFSPEEGGKVWRLWRTWIGFLASYRYFPLKTRLWLTVLKFASVQWLACGLVLLRAFPHYLRYECQVLRPVAKFYRRIRRHGEFAPMRSG